MTLLPYISYLWRGFIPKIIYHGKLPRLCKHQLKCSAALTVKQTKYGVWRPSEDPRHANHSRNSDQDQHENRCKERLSWFLLVSLLFVTNYYLGKRYPCMNLPRERSFTLVKTVQSSPLSPHVDLVKRVSSIKWRHAQESTVWGFRY